MKNTVATLLVAASTLAMAATANADTSFKPYVGVDYNYNNSNNFNYNSGTVNVGTQFNDYFGTEVFYQKSDDDVKNVRHSAEKETTSFDAYGLDLMGYLPMGCEQEFALIGSAGVGEYTVDKSYNWTGYRNTNDHGIGYRFGLGAMYNVTNDVAVKAMARYVKFNQIEDFSDMMEYTAGVRYSF